MGLSKEGAEHCTRQFDTILDRLAAYLDSRGAAFRYVKDYPRMEVWVRGKEWYPLLISEIGQERYRVSWGDEGLEFRNPEGLYHYVLRIFRIIEA
jgi:hypothetical protein